MEMDLNDGPEMWLSPLDQTYSDACFVSTVERQGYFSGFRNIFQLLRRWKCGLTTDIKLYLPSECILHLSEYVFIHVLCSEGLHILWRQKQERIEDHWV